MPKIRFYILPGDTRKQDRIVPAADLRFRKYSPSEDHTLSVGERLLRPDLFVVTVNGGECGIYPFIVPCYFDPQWDSLKAYGDSIGRAVLVGPPVDSGSDFVSRSIVTSHILLTDGTIHQVRAPGTGPHAFSERFPLAAAMGSIEALLAASDEAVALQPSS